MDEWRSLTSLSHNKCQIDMGNNEVLNEVGCTYGTE